MTAVRPPHTLAPLLAGFAAVSLEQVIERARLLHRRDNKYVLDAAQLQRFLAWSQSRFQVLEIGGLRQFGYSSHYLDTPQLQCFRDHNQGKRRRIKVRFRHYEDHERYFFEVKHKGLRNLTHKERIIASPAEMADPALAPRLQAYLQQVLHHAYGPDWPAAAGADWQHSLQVSYRRSTLLAFDRAERITLDQDIRFTSTDGRTAGLGEGRWLIEVKSRTGNCLADRWLLHQGIRATPACSKYGMGVGLLLRPHHNNRFRPVLRRHFGVTPHALSD